MFQDIDKAMRNIMNSKRKAFRDMVIVTMVSILSILGAMWALDNQLAKVDRIDQETIAQHNMERSK